jgi:hypothetical protein
MLLLPTDLLGPRGATDMSGLRQEDAALAYLIDRAHQYSPSSGLHGALLEIAGDVARGQHMDAFLHGELDDLADQIERLKGSPQLESGICPKCAGDGEVEGPSRYPDDSGIVLCRDCDGSGKRKQRHLRRVK